MVIFKIAAMALGCSLSLAYVAQDPPAKKDAAVGDKGKDAVEGWVERAIGADASKEKGIAPLRIPYKVAAVDHELVRKTFDGDRFYSVHTKIMPRPDMVPKAIRTVKLVRVAADGTVEPIQNIEAFKALLCAKFTGIRDDAQARTALLTALRLAEEYYQDGNMKFTVPEASISVSTRGDKRIASGKATVSQGGKGELQVSMEFDASGVLKPDDIKISGRVQSNTLLR